MIIETRELCKTFRSRRGDEQRAVDRLTLSIPEGGVFGLLGPNGSGKTTTLRMLFGLVRATSGAMHILGHRVPAELPAVLPQIGGLIEGPLLFPTFSGRRNLEILARVRGLTGKRIDEALEMVDLTDRQHDPVRQYSLGMRQRLGIATALLGDPRVLLLDEPSNGLDPAGMAQMRSFIAGVAASGKVTVVLSSHLLAEVEQVCDRVAILNHGALAAVGTAAELASQLPQEPSREVVRVVVDDPGRARAVLGDAGLEVIREDRGLLVRATDRRRVMGVLAGAGVDVLEVSQRRDSLEDTFLALTKEPT